MSAVLTEAAAHREVRDGCLEVACLLLLSITHLVAAQTILSPYFADLCCVSNKDPTSIAVAFEHIQVCVDACASFVWLCRDVLLLLLSA